MKLISQDSQTNHAFSEMKPESNIKQSYNINHLTKTDL